EGTDLDELRVQALDHLDLGGKVAVFSRAVRVLVVDEKEIIAVPQPAQGVHLIAQGRARIGYVHAHEASQTFVHRIDGKRHGAKPRRVTMLVGASDAKIRAASATKRLTALAVFSESWSAPLASRGLCPVCCGSVSLTASPRWSPRNTTTKRCSRTGSTNTSMS